MIIIISAFYRNDFASPPTPHFHTGPTVFDFRLDKGSARASTHRQHQLLLLLSLTLSLLLSIWSFCAHDENYRFCYTKQLRSIAALEGKLLPFALLLLWHPEIPLSFISRLPFRAQKRLLYFIFSLFISR